MEKDLQKKGYFYDPERFADLINGVVCSGRQILLPSDLIDMDSQTGQFNASAGQDKQRKKLKDRHRDLMRKAALISKQVRQRKDITETDFISGFARDSRLGPCVTLVLYYGEKWDGTTDLHGILDFSGIPEELRDVVNNYKIYLCEVRQFNNTDVFRTDLKQVFDCVRYSDDPEKLYEIVSNDPTYREMDGDTYELIAQYLKTNELMQVKRCEKKEGKVDMCKAIAELIEGGRRQGMEQGIAQGIEKVIRAMIETSRELGSTREETIGRIVEKMQISDDEAEKYVGEYWK